MKKVIYQLMPRLFSNQMGENKIYGSKRENGCGKFKYINRKALESLKKLGVTDIWLTGVIQHATTTDYSMYNIPRNNPLIVKGRAGSPYAISNYYQVDPDLAINVNKRMLEFESLIERIHNNDMKVIIDFVANHVARQYAPVKDNSNIIFMNTKKQLETVLDSTQSTEVTNNNYVLGRNDKIDKFFDKDNSFYYMQNHKLSLPNETYDRVKQYFSIFEDYDEFPAKVTGDNKVEFVVPFESWYDTVKINYGVDISDNSKHFNPIPKTWYCMLDILKYWLSKKVDGFRCDMAEMVPIEFWQWAIAEVKKEYPNAFFIAEIYQPELYYDFLEIAKFDYLYDKIDMYESLKSIIKGYQNVECITHSWQHTMKCNDKMLRFIENHDEVRIASKQFANDPFRAIPAFAIAALMHQGPIMLYNGQELGEKGDEVSGYSGDDGKTTIFDYWCMDTQNRWINNGYFDTKKLTLNEKSLRKKYKTILNFAISDSMISYGTFYDLMWINTHLINMNCYAFLRNIGSKYVVIAANFNPDPIDIIIKLTNHVREYLGLGTGNTIEVNMKIAGYDWKYVTDDEINNMSIIS